MGEILESPKYLTENTTEWSKSLLLSHLREITIYPWVGDTLFSSLNINKNGESYVKHVRTA